MVKRQSVEDGGADRGVVINEVQQLITSGNQQMQMTGCAIITALMQAFLFWSLIINVYLIKYQTFSIIIGLLISLTNYALKLLGNN